jgi:hypothetical protein
MKLSAKQQAIREVYQKIFTESSICESNMQNVFTRYELCEDIVDKIKYKSDTKILVLNLEFAIILMERGISPNCIDFWTDCKDKADVAIKIGVNVMSDDFFDFFDKVQKHVETRKWDLVIGNPPYQDPQAKSSKKLWKPFLRTSIEILKDNGYLAFITPFSWGTPDNDIFDVFVKNQVKMVNLDGKKHFPDVGTTISWYIIQKTTTTNLTEIICNDEKIMVDFRSIVFLPSDINKVTIDILGKFLSVSPKLNIKYDFFCEQRKPIMNTTQNNVYKYPVKHTASQLLYSSVPHPNTKIKKVVFPISSAMKAEYDGNGDYGCSQHYAWIEVKNKHEADSIISYLNSDIIRWLRKVTHWSASWSRPILDMIPSISTNTVPTNESIYETFHINSLEQEYIRGYK